MAASASGSRALPQQTIEVALSSLSGAPVQLEPFPPDATVRDLALQVRARLSMPISVQNLIHGTHTLTDPSMMLAEAFGGSRSAELMVVRRPFTPEERAQLYRQVVRAAAAGHVSALRELLREGAQVNFKAEGHGVDTSTSLSHWREAEEVGEAENWASPHDAAAAAAAKKSQAMDSDDGTDSDSEDDVSVASSGPATPRDRAPGAPDIVEAPCGGLTPLLAAIAVGDEELARDLRQLGAEEPDMDTRHADLKEAFRHMDFADVVKHLVAGADVNTRLRREHGIDATSEGAPLHVCVVQHRRPGAYEVAQILIRKGADMSAPDSEGDNPMAHARYFNAIELLNLFKGHGAKIEGPFFRRFGERG